MREKNLRGNGYVYMSDWVTLSYSGNYHSQTLKKRRKKQTNNNNNRVPVVAQKVKNLTRIHEHAGLIPGLTQWLTDPALPQTVA